MSKTLAIELSDDVKQTFDSAAREEGLPEDKFAATALSAYLFIRRFRRLRDRLKAEAKVEYSDEQIFDLVS